MPDADDMRRATERTAKRMTEHANDHGSNDVTGSTSYEANLARARKLAEGHDKRVEVEHKNKGKN